MFKRLQEDARPMPCPLFSEAVAPSPLPCTPSALGHLAHAVLEWGKTFSGENGGGVRGGGLVPPYSQAEGTRGGGAGGDKDKSPDTAVMSTATENKSAVCVSVGVNDGVGFSVENEVGGEVSVGAGVSGDGDHGGSASGNDVGEGKDDVRDGNTTGRRPSEVRATAASKSSSNSSSCSDGGDDNRPALPSSSNPSVTSKPTPWKTGRFALEMQAPWAKCLLNGKKTIETRAYALPEGLLNRPIEVMESEPGEDGVSSLGDTVDALYPGLSVLGRVVFKSSEAYQSRGAWEGDESRHLVSPTSSSAGYGWKGPGCIHAWTVGEVAGVYPKPRRVRPMKRALRSLFEVEEQPKQDHRGAGVGIGVVDGGVKGDIGGGEQESQECEGSAFRGEREDAPVTKKVEKKKKKPKKKRARKSGGQGQGQAQTSVIVEASPSKSETTVVADDGDRGGKKGEEDTRRVERERTAAGPGQKGENGDEATVAVVEISAHQGGGTPSSKKRKTNIKSDNSGNDIDDGSGFNSTGEKQGRVRKKTEDEAPRENLVSVDLGTKKKRKKKRF